MESDSWTWGELFAAVQGWQERMRQEQRGLAMLLYRYGMYFVPGEKQNAPQMFDLFPVWTDEEIREIQLAQLKARMAQFSATPIKPKEANK